MIDINLIRENPVLVKENIKKKFQDEKLKLVDEVLKLDKKWRKLKYDEDALRSERNKVSKQVGEFMKNGEKNKADKLKIEAKKIPDRIEKIQEEQEKRKNERDEILGKLPNIMSPRVPIGKDDSENVVEQEFGKKKEFDFELMGHVELAEKLDIADFESSRRTSGSGFYYIQGDLALLNMALINYARETMIKHGFTYVETPYMLGNDVINRVTDLHDQENMVFRIKNDDLSLIGTSEHSLIGRFIDKEIDIKKLPIKHTSYSMCFRREIGSHGIDEKGLFRTHQFNKQEMIVICLPEESDDFFEKMKNITIEIFNGLELPTRVLRLCSGDLGDLKYEQIDIEVWSPRRKNYFEVGSCSNLTESQARKLGITTRVKGVGITPHTLNNTAIATSRALVAIMENHQNKDGSINIPKVLWPYMCGKQVIKK